jgi:hypothetical protein
MATLSESRKAGKPESRTGLMMFWCQVSIP